MKWILATLFLLTSTVALAAPQRVVLVGDSLSSTLYFAGQFLGWQYNVSVLGVGSTSSGDGVGDGDGESVATKITNGDIVAGDIVVLMYGTNDYRAEDGLPTTGMSDTVEQTVQNMLTMAAQVAAVPAVPVVVAPPPCDDGVGGCVQDSGPPFYDRYDYLAALAPALATAFGRTSYSFLDAWTLFDNEAQGVDTLLGAAPDSVHPNAAGRILLWRAVNAKLEEISPPPSDEKRP